MKKMGFVFAVMFGLVSFAQALDMQALQAAFERANATAKAEHAQKNVPPSRFADPQKQEAFNYYLIKGVEILNKSGNLEGCHQEICGLTREHFLVLVLENAVRSYFEYEDSNGRSLTNDEYRAVDYAIFTLMMNGDEKERFAAYRPYLGYTKEWLEEHPVENWNEYVVACEKAMNYFYEAMKMLVEADRQGPVELNNVLNYSTWMMMTH